MLADDLGWGDLGCFGQKTLSTPHLDRLASEGMRLTRHYAGSTVCAPSRCVLMTGLHTGHARIRGNGNALLREEDFTVAELFQENGYRTGCFGKWGVGHPPPLNDPNRHGFDEFYGYVNMHHAHNFYPEFLIRNGRREKLRNVTKEVWRVKDRLEGGPREGSGVAKVKVDYAPYLIETEALRFIGKPSEKPFFLYLALNTPHANNEGGTDKEQRDGMEVPDYGEFAKKDWPDPEKGFAAMIRDIDNTVGKVLEALEEHGHAKNTLFVFSSDNGPHQEGRHQMEFFDSNGPLRGMKRDLTDGGIRAPTIAHWPGKVAPGTESDHLSGFQDFLPTAAELLGAPLPGTIDGISFLPTILGENNRQKEHDYLYWEFQEKGGKIGVVTREWKAIRRNTNRPGATPSLELYDLRSDPEELRDVSAEHPEVVKKLSRWMEDAHTDIAP